MARASDAQVQQYVNERVRVRAELLRSLLASLQDDVAAIDDIYEHVTNANGIPATWTDNRTDGPPHLLGPSDVAAYNSYIQALIPHIKDAADYNIIVKACVRPV